MYERFEWHSNDDDVGGGGGGGGAENGPADEIADLETLSLSSSSSFVAVEIERVGRRVMM